MSNNNQKNKILQNTIKEQDKFQLLFKTMNLGVTYQNSKGEITDVNNAALNILGLSLDQMQGKTSLDPSWKCIHEDGSDYPGETHPSMIALKTGKPVLNKIMGIINSSENDYRWIKIDAIPQFKDKEKKPYQVFTTFDDITELKKGELLLKENQERYNKLQQIGKVGNWEYNFKTGQLWASEQAQTIFGFDPKTDQLTVDLIESCIINRKYVRKSITNFIKNGGEYSLEYQIKPKNKGTIRTVHSTAEISYNKNGKLLKMVGVLQDISKKKKAENNLKESQENFFKILKNSTAPIVLARLKDYEIINSNDAAAKFTGYSNDKLIGAKLFDIDIWDSKKESKIFIEKVKKNGKVKNYEASFTIKSEKNKIWLISGEIIIINNEEFILIIVENITETRKIQEALKQQNDFAFALTENHPAGIVACDAEGKLVLFNKTAKKWHGIDLLKIPQEEWAKNYGLYKSNSKTLLKTSEIPLIKALNNQKVANQQMVIKAKNQEPRHVLCNASTFFDKEGKKLGALVIMNDVTAQKLTEKDLKRSQKKIKKALKEVEQNEFLLKESEKIANVGSWEINILTQKVSWSDQVFKLHGLPIGELPLLENALDFFIDGSKEILEKAIEESIAQNKKYDLELRFQNAQKEKLWVNTIGYPVTNKKNEVVGIRGVIQDITEKKLSREKIEKALEDVELSEFLLKESEKIANVGSWEIDLATQKVKWSDQVFKLHGLPVGEYPSLKDAINFYTGKSKKILTKAIEESVAQNKKYDLELKFQNAQKEELWINTIGFPVTNEKNQVIGLRGVIQDITERKLNNIKIKDALKKAEQSEFLLNESGRIAKIGAWDFDIETQKVRWSNQVFKIYGIPIGEIPTFEIALCHYVDGSREILEKALEHSIKNNEKFDLELRFKNAQNQKIWVNSIGYPTTNDKGEVIGLRGVIQDITEHKLTRAKVAKSQEMQSLLANHTSDIICLQEEDSTFRYITPSIKNILGYEQTEFIGKTIFKIVHKEDLDDLKETMKNEIFKGQYKEAYTFRVRHKKGHYVWLEFLSSPVYKNKKISYFVTSARDITQWILAKERIQKYQTSLQKLTSEITLIEEKQKKKIASNIHDHLSQSLVISKMKINQLKKDSKLEGINNGLKFIEDHISEALENSRKITFELSPPVLYQLGIIEAVSWLLDDLEAKHKIKFKLETKNTNFKLSEIKSIILYRSIQEVLTNAIKYAKASLITIHINKNLDQVDIDIIDDGLGFDTSILNNGHKNKTGSGFGLFAVQEKIRNVEGTFTITSEINKGTSVKISIPL
ncbi:PAS domain S-box protein [Polaribacter gochangensis]|uniref:PAS domain S-box protein n=1 Tax=Polaribacter gochangensis TaxID=3252903 RepID=UPI003904688D